MNVDPIGEGVGEPANKVVDLGIGEPVDEVVGLGIGEPIDEVVGPGVGEPVDEVVDHIVPETVHEVVDPIIPQTVYEVGTKTNVESEVADEVNVEDEVGVEVGIGAEVESDYHRDSDTEVEINDKEMAANCGHVEEMDDHYTSKDLEFVHDSNCDVQVTQSCVKFNLMTCVLSLSSNLVCNFVHFNSSKMPFWSIMC